MRCLRLGLPLMLAAMACTFSFDRALNPGEIRGTLVFESSGSTNLPASGAKVVLENSGLVVQADPHGGFVISNLPPGSYALTVTATNTSTNTPEGLRLQGITLTGNGAGLANGRDLGQVVIGAYGSIAGAVTGPNEPVPAGTLVVSQGQTQVAVAQGAYQIPNLIPGPYQLSVFAPANSGAQIAGPVTVNVQPRSQATAPTFKLDTAPIVTTGSVTGTVLLAGMGSNAGIEVTLVGSMSVNLQTDASGNYSAPQLPPGIYTVIAQIGGFAAVSVPDILVGGGVTQVPLITLEPQTGTQGTTDAGPPANAILTAACQQMATCGSTQFASASACAVELQGIYFELTGLTACAATAAALLSSATCIDTETCGQLTSPEMPGCQAQNAALAAAAQAGGTPCQAAIAPLRVGQGTDGGAPDGGVSPDAGPAISVIVHAACENEANCEGFGTSGLEAQCEVQFNAMATNLASSPLCTAANQDLPALFDCVATAPCSDFASPDGGTDAGALCPAQANALSVAAEQGGALCIAFLQSAGMADGGSNASVIIDSACLQQVMCGYQFPSVAACESQLDSIYAGLTGDPACSATAAALLTAGSCIAAETCEQINSPTASICTGQSLALQNAANAGGAACQQIIAPLSNSPDGGVVDGGPDVPDGGFPVWTADGGVPVDGGFLVDAGPPVFPAQWATLNDRPGVRQGAPLLYDPARARLLTFGGQFGPSGQALDDGALWALNVGVPAGQAGWQKLTPGGTPPVFDWQQSAFADTANDRIVIYSQTGVVFLQFDSSDTTLTQAGVWTPAMEMNAPPYHAGASWTIAPEYGNAYLFGGLVPGSPPTAVNDLWVFPLLPTTHPITWGEFAGSSAGGQVPPGLYSAAMTFVPGQGLVVYGGATRTVNTGADAGPAFTDTPWLETYLMPMPGPFEWVILNNGLTGAPNDGTSVQASLLVEPVTGNVVLIGSTELSNNTFLRDTWSMTVTGSPASWTDWVSNATGGFGSRAGAGVTSNLSGSVIYGFGGFNGSTPTNDLWELDVGAGGATSGWVKDMAQTDEYVNAAAVYDSVNDQVVLFGGTPAYAPGSPAGEMLLTHVAPPFSSPVDWTSLPQTTPPANRAGAVAGYDPDFKQLWLFGGAGGLGDTQSVDLQSGGAWTAAWGSLLSGGTPGARLGAAGTFDTVNENFIVFGGTPTDGSGNVTGATLNDIWVLPGGALGESWEQWLQVAPSSGTPPVPVKNAAATYDPFQQQMLLFGGEDDSGNVYNTVYALALPFCVNGAPCDEGPVSWSVVTTTGVGPSPRSQASIVWDNAAQKLFVFGGSQPGVSAPDADFFQLDFSQHPAVWTQLCPGGDAPAGRAGANLLVTQYGLLLYGGALQTGSAFPADNAQYIIGTASLPACL